MTKVEYLGRNEFGQFTNYLFRKGKNIVEITYDYASKDYEVAVGTKLYQNKYTQMWTLENPKKKKFFDYKMKAWRYAQKLLGVRKLDKIA